MPFYEILCITAHYPDYTHIRSLVKTSCQSILDRGGVVRSLHSIGTKTLPQRMRRHKAYHEIGDYWMMRFDASPRTLKVLVDALRQDPRVIRWTTLKLGERLEDVERPKEKTIRRAPEPLPEKLHPQFP